MVLIDTLIHRYHWELEGGLSRPGAGDLIGGKPQDTIDFLNNLTYGAKSSPEILATRQNWIAKQQASEEVAASVAAERRRWRDEKAHRKQLKRQLRERAIDDKRTTKEE
jgi:hypothetical protein